MRNISDKNKTILSAIVLLVGLIWIWTSRVDAQSITQDHIATPQIGFVAPDFSLKNQTDESVVLSEFMGNVILINLWASWCLPCRKEMPIMQRVYQDYKDKGFIVFAVNVTNQDNRSDAIAFFEKNNLSFPLLFDDTGDVSNLYRLHSLPTTFFVGRDGIIDDIVYGGPMSEALIRTKVEQMLKDTP
ncbi:MAG TPA: TlpA family protein disulfide reductase [Anaerolineae bacterium]|nr:TlpA family protein disulfide reductase [Anaerolineae bacterium]